MKRKIFYWQGILGDQNLLVTFEESINKLLDGDYQAAELDLKKLSGHRVYSIRVNHSDRLLFTTIIKGDKSFLLLLEVIKNHDYQKSRFLKPSVLANYLEINAEAFTKQIKEENFSTPAENPTLSQNKKENNLNYAPVEFYNQTFIEFNDTQQQALLVKKPLLISGAPGSGKSCVALSLLVRAVEESFDANERCFVYVTQSDRLARRMQILWEQLPSSQHPDGRRVQFKTYEQLLLDLEPGIASKSLVDETHCLNWISDHLKKNVKNSPQLKAFFAGLASRFQDIYQEFRLISGYTREEYLALGQRQSLFSELKQKEWLFNAYEHYTIALETNHQLHVTFHCIKQRDIYAFVVVDEAQDFSMLQLKQLHQLTKKSEICYCMDSHQSLKDNRSKRPHLLAFLRSAAYNLTHLVLPSSYRCPAKVVKTANALLKLKYQLTGGLADKDEQQEISLSADHASNAGEVQWLPNNDQLETLKKCAQGIDFAIVTLKEFKEEAAKLFKTPLYFSIVVI